MTASCSTCQFRFEGKTPAPRADLHDREFIQCRRNAPAPDPINRLAMWPEVKPTDFCAEHPGFEPAAPPPSPEDQAQLL